MDTILGEPHPNAVSPPATSRVPPVPTRRVLVWDLPTRLLHWMLAGSFTGAFLIAVTVKHRDAMFPVHMLLGAIAVTAVALRALWGLVGSRYARFGSFPVAPKAVLGYLRGLVTRREERRVGHNPANAAAALAMFACVIGLGVTGVLMARGARGVRTLHEALAYSLVALVVAHLVGILAHTIRHRENIALGMFDGRKAATSAQAITSAHAIVAGLFLAVVAGVGGELVHSYDSASRTVSLPGLGKLRLRGGRGGDNATARGSRGGGANGRNSAGGG